MAGKRGAGKRDGLKLATTLLACVSALLPVYAQSLMPTAMPKVVTQEGFMKPNSPPSAKAPAPTPAPTPASQPNIRIVGNPSIYSQEEIERAIAVLRTHCQPLGGEQWADLTDITARITPEYAPYRQEKGWKTAIHVTAVISAKPRFIPAEEGRMGVFAGHTLYFFMGGASAPGIFVSRQIGKYLCGLPSYESGDIEFIPAPELDFLNR